MCLSKNNSQAIRPGERHARYVARRTDAGHGVKERVGAGGHTMMAELEREAEDRCESQLGR